MSKSPTAMGAHVVETRLGAQKWGLQQDPWGWVGRDAREKCPDVTHRSSLGGALPRTSDRSTSNTHAGLPCESWVLVGVWCQKACSNAGVYFPIGQLNACGVLLRRNAGNLLRNRTSTSSRLLKGLSKWRRPIFFPAGDRSEDIYPISAPPLMRSQRSTAWLSMPIDLSHWRLMSQPVTT
jgi:hypothetical protein